MSAQVRSMLSDACHGAFGCGSDAGSARVAQLVGELGDPAGHPVDASLALLDMTPYGRRKAWQDDPEGRPVPQWMRVGATPEHSLGRGQCWMIRSSAPAGSRI